MKTVTFTSTLIRLAREEGRARLSGDPVQLANAERAHENYRRACLDSDEMWLSFNPRDRVDIPSQAEDGWDGMFYPPGC